MATSFPCKLVLDFPFPTARLANVALKALSVDPELSPLVQRQFSIVIAPKLFPASLHDNPHTTDPVNVVNSVDIHNAVATDSSSPTILRVVYTASTNRMLRVAVSSFLATVQLVLEVMEKLDVDVALPADDPDPDPPIAVAPQQD